MNEKTYKHEKKEELSFDHQIDHLVESALVPLHSILSKKNMDLRDPQLDIAIEKLSSAMTSLQSRSRQLKEKGTYGNTK